MSGWPTQAGRAGVAAAISGATLAVAVVGLWAHDGFSLILAVQALTQLPLAVVGALAVRASPRNPVAWLLLSGGAFMPVGIAAYLYGHAVYDLGHVLPGALAAGWMDGWPWVFAQLPVALVAPLLFPDGRLPSPRWRVLVAASVALSAALFVSLLFSPTLLDWTGQPNPTGLPGAAGELAAGLLSLILLVAPLSLGAAVGFEVRLRRLVDPAARAAARQVRPAIWLIVGSWWSCLAMGAAGASTLYSLPVESLGMSVLGATCAVAIRRYQLFDARPVVRRAVVYGGLTAVILVAYAVAAVTLERLGAAQATEPVALVVAILIALPLRDQLQRAANRLVFGLRDDPVATLLFLGEQLERAAAVDDVLPAAARSLRETLRLQHVAILDGERVAAEAGAPGPGRQVEIPLIYVGERVGSLVATQAEGDIPLGPERETLLAGIARPVAAALRATALSRDLATSHGRLITVTEEERRRIRRDLHDGLGPTLSSAVLGVARANALLVSRPAAAAEQLEQLTGILQQAVADVRHLVYDLRPPELDQLGLVGALDEHARSLGHFTVTSPHALPRLGAAAEVAAYRIAMEAMTNSIRHARASRGTVTITLDGGLRVEVEDDGIGLPDGYRAGVGITSMRERAAELGGRCEIEPGRSGGTVVRAWLPS